MYYIQKFGIDEHLTRLGVSDKRGYLLSLMGRISFVLQTVPHDREFAEYKSALNTSCF